MADHKLHGKGGRKKKRHRPPPKTRREADDRLAKTERRLARHPR